MTFDAAPLRRGGIERHGAEEDEEMTINRAVRSERYAEGDSWVCEEHAREYARPTDFLDTHRWPCDRCVSAAMRGTRERPDGPRWAEVEAEIATSGLSYQC